MSLNEIITTTLDIERPKIKSKVFLNNKYFYPNFIVATEKDLSGITYHKGKLYLLGNSNKKLYILDNETKKPLAVKDIPAVVDTNVKNLIGVSIARTYAGERIFILLDVLKGNINTIMLLEMDLDLNTACFFYLDTGSYVFPDYSSGFGRGMCTDGSSLYIHGGKEAEVVYRLSTRGALLGIYNRGNLADGGQKTYNIGNIATIGRTYGYDSSISLVDQKVSYEDTLYSNEAEFKKTVLRKLITNLTIPASASLDDITPIWNDDIDSDTGKAYKICTACYYIGKVPECKKVSGIEFINGLPLIGRKSSAYNTSSKADYINNCLLRYKNKLFDPAKTYRLYGVEPFSGGESLTFSGDFTYDGKKFWVVDKESLYEYDYVYHCFKVQNQTIDDIDLDVVRKGSSKTLEVDFCNVSERLDLLNINISVKDMPDILDDDFIYLSLDNVEFGKEINIEKVSLGESVTLYIKCDVPTDIDIGDYDNKVSFLDVVYEAI